MVGFTRQRFPWQLRDAGTVQILASSTQQTMVLSLVPASLHLCGVPVVTHTASPRRQFTVGHAWRTLAMETTYSSADTVPHYARARLNSPARHVEYAYGMPGPSCLLRGLA